MVVARGTKFGTLYTIAGFWDDKNKKILRHCDVAFDESVLYKDREQKVLEITKQVGVEVELEKSNPRDVEADTQSNPTEKSEVEQVTPEQVVRRSSRSIRAPDRPDIAHVVGVVSRYMVNPGKEHWEAVKWLLRYLRVFVDADLGGDVDSSKSTSS
ncbi:uncharacterized protein [Solanum lycopersicum]|uniref:uncharacterized protein n=1 Tax=Solanum lycopersicum TaxID=4081 RepID=UPI003747A7CA